MTTLPEGWALVPREPSDGMIEIGQDYIAQQEGMGFRIYAADVFEKMLEAAPAPPALAGGVKVRALEWNEYEHEGDVDRWDAEAGTLHVYYEIELNHDGYRASFDGAAFSLHDTLDAAKAAAQADYEHRILAALIPAPASELDALKAEIAAKDAEIERLNKVISSACRWYWPEDDTSSDACQDGPWDIYSNAPAGEIVAVSCGGVIETRYYAWLPPADDADSDDDFEVDEASADLARIKVGAELARRAALNGGSNG